ncbi:MULTISPECIES: diaminopimelate epimerase [Haloarcula]|uniref:Diaminopimelate epimerase n=1 Tax=Haloarcula pellucida TaxID=1427151 RepID=A0A830GLD5_9EURY|nr:MULTISPECIES: diaminopimelate epimerase [Halomicroarcula]MBX0349949.1 diaminopimelate epimerase [Halomicroarcula pellucida]MDS0279697.1 diaminopimelate epimerase [Halomicroarcula sp. S1AR25-4]GGN95157.1 diaminopimelate epimerase [Halomicroarcula pellucida]
MNTVKKYDALGNDFFVLSAAETTDSPSALAREWCDSDSGLTVRGGETGADGLLRVEPLSERTLEMELFEPDGTTSPMCGNGVRCVAKWAHNVLGYTDVTVETEARTCAATIDADGGVTVELGSPSYVDGVDETGLRETLSVETALGDVSLVDSGVYHLLVQVGDVAKENLEALTEQVRRTVEPPQRINVTLWAPAAGGVDQRTYEVGVEDETDACGTGALAIGYHTDRTGVADGTVSVRPPGGELQVAVRAEDAVLSGPAEEVGQVDVPL